MQNKDKMKLPRVKMPEQPALERIHNFNEVNLGLTQEMAVNEAQRCIQCPKPKCIEGCPVSVKIPQFIAAIANSDFAAAASKLKEDNVLPAVCGRVCPQEEQCEKVCVLGLKHQSVAIGNLERFAADWERNNAKPITQNNSISPNAKSVAVIGGGPAGLSCAGDLNAMGYKVTVFEALHDIGGVLLYGIPEFRLPKSIVSFEVKQLASKGVEFVKDYIIGLTETIDELLERFDACFIGVGAGLPYFLNVPGEDLVGIYAANEFLTRVNLMKGYDFPNSDTPVIDIKDKNVAVFGGGNTAMDSVRTALRLGAKRAMIMYRRTEAEMPARKEEIAHSKEEGVEYMLLVAPVRFNGDENGRLQSVTIQKMQLGEPDASGRRRPVAIEGAIEDIQIDAAIIAIGNGSNPIISRTTPDLNVNKWGNIIVDENTMATNKPGVFAGGDIVTGGATVILAMGAGRTAAKAIDKYLKQQQKF
jgi:glutamate synthase (NADPH/NADH) small chain